MELAFLIVLSITLLFLGISAYLSNVTSKTTKYFLSFIVLVILWIFSNYASNTLSTYWMVLLSNRLIFVFTTLLAWVLFLFATVYPNSKSIISKKQEIIGATFTVITTILGFTPLVVEKVTIEGSYSSIEFGPLIPIYLVHFLIFFVLFVVLLVKKYKIATGTERVQLQYLMLGIVFTAIGTMFTNLILPLGFQVFSFSNYGPIFFLIFVGFTSTSIARHRLFGIRFLLGKILLFLGLSLFTLVSFYFFSWIFVTVFGGLFEANALLISFLVAPLYSWSFLKFHSYLYKLIEERFIYIDFHPAKTLSKFLKISSTELDINKIAVYVVNTVKNVLDLKRVGIILFDKESTKILYKKLIGFELDGSRDLLQVIHYWQDIGEDPILVLEEVRKQPGKYKNDSRNRLEKVLRCMESANISAILPLNRKVQLNGIIIIGNKGNNSALSVEDMDFLEDIIANASVAIGRSILYEEVNKFNETLKDKVAAQTRDLKEKVELLNEARRKEHDMIDIMGHELRTPITIIKNYYELLNPLLANTAFYKSTERTSVKYKEYLKVIGKSIDREIKLINTLLSATKLDDGQLVLNKEAVDIVSVIEDGILGQSKNAKEKGIYLKFEKPSDYKDYPKIYADKIRIHEIIDNLLNNAVKYTEKGGVLITLKNEAKYAKINIIDTGIGIHENDIKNLGKKFYRSKQYIAEGKDTTPLVRPGGTGLGLFVTFGLVKAHGGDIRVESKLGKGSTFSLSLPFVNGDEEKDSKLVQSNDMFERLGLKR